MAFKREVFLACCCAFVIVLCYSPCAIIYICVERLTGSAIFIRSTKFQILQTWIWELLLTLLHVSKQLKQNWCMHEFVKHLLLILPKQMAQLGGGEPAPLRSSAELSSLVLCANNWFLRNSRIRAFGSVVGVAGHSLTTPVSAITFNFVFYMGEKSMDHWEYRLSQRLCSLTRRKYILQINTSFSVIAIGEIYLPAVFDTMMRVLLRSLWWLTIVANDFRQTKIKPLRRNRVGFLNRKVHVEVLVLPSTQFPFRTDVLKVFIAIFFDNCLCSALRTTAHHFVLIYLTLFCRCFVKSVNSFLF